MMARTSIILLPDTKKQHFPHLSSSRGSLEDVHTCGLTEIRCAISMASENSQAAQYVVF
jgi:hypothetical protein